MPLNKLLTDWNRNDGNLFKTARFTIPSEAIIPVLKELGIIDAVGLKTEAADKKVILGGAKQISPFTIMLAFFGIDDTDDQVKRRTDEALAQVKVTELLAKDHGSPIDPKLTNAMNDVVAKIVKVRDQIKQWSLGTASAPSPVSSILKENAAARDQFKEIIVSFNNLQEAMSKIMNAMK